MTVLTRIKNSSSYLAIRQALNASLAGVLPANMIADENDPLPTAITTKPDLSAILAPTTVPKFAPAGSAAATQIIVDATQKFQTFMGVGAAITDSTAFNMMTYLSKAQRTAFLQETFGVNGFSTIRISLGSCDYNRDTNYKTYDDVENDAAMANFDIAFDEEFQIPLIKEILAINPRVRIFAAPWIPPVWMKDNNTFINGNFVETAANFAAYALYVTKAIQAYAAAGITITYVTPQNEPTQGATTFPGTKFTASGYGSLTTALVNAFQTAGITATKILAYDDNWYFNNNVAFLSAVFAGPSAASVAGVAFHAYSGTPDFAASLMANYPGKEIHMTEHCYGSGSSNDTVMSGMMGNDLIGAIRAGHMTSTQWNLMLDTSYGPQAPAASVFRGCSTVSKDGLGTIVRAVEYYAQAHVGRYVNEGAVRIASTSLAANQSGTDIETTALLNTDGTTVVLIWNGASSAKSITLTDAVSGYSTTFSVPARSAMTVTYAAIVGALSAIVPSGTTAGSPLVVSGCYPAGTTPTSLTYSIDGGAAVAAPSPTISGGFFSFTITTPSAGHHALRVTAGGTTSRPAKFSTAGAVGLSAPAPSVAANGSNGTTVTAAPTGGTSPYSIQFRRAPDNAGAPGTYANVGTASATATYNDTGLTSGTKYWYDYVVTDSSGTPATATSGDSSFTVGSAGTGTPGQVGAWTPANLTGLAVWYDPRNTSTLTATSGSVANGSVINAFNASGGTGNLTQGTAGKQPSYSTAGLNGYPALTFDGARGMGTAGVPSGWPTGAAAMTMYAAASLSTATPTGSPKVFGYGNAASNSWRFLGTKSGGNTILGSVYGNPGSNDQTSTLPWTSTGNIAGWTIDASGNSNIYEDGGTPYTGSTGTLSTATNYFFLGSSTNNGAVQEGWLGAVGDVVLTTGVLSTSDRQKLEGYLAWKYGLAGNLPSGHPYKSAPPQS